jgi:hypothetical protein
VPIRHEGCVEPFVWLRLRELKKADEFSRAKCTEELWFLWEGMIGELAARLGGASVRYADR